MKKMKKFTMLVIGAVLVGVVVVPAVPGFAFGLKAFVEKTGQTECWDEFGGSIPDCDGTGQDGDLQRGVRLPEPRFIDLGNGWVLDRLTWLQWLKDANCIANNPGFDTDGIADDGKVFWQTGLNFVDDLNNNEGMCDQTNHRRKPARLPNVKELQSLIHFGFSDPALSDRSGTVKWSEGDPFENVQSSFYWSSTTSADCDDCAWDVSLLNGWTRDGGKAGTSFVWPVRGGVGW